MIDTGTKIIKMLKSINFKLNVMFALTFSAFSMLLYILKLHSQSSFYNKFWYDYCHVQMRIANPIHL
jgi:hypothetical protein